MKEFLKRVLLFLVTAFILVNTLAFFILNSPTVQQAILRYVNHSLLAPYKLRFSFNSVHVNFFAKAIQVNQFSLASTEESAQPFQLSADTFSASFEVTNSYLARKPIIHKVHLSGVNLSTRYDDKQHLILPEFLNQPGEGTSLKTLNVPELLRKLFSVLPSEIELFNVRVTLGEESQKNYQQVAISSLLLAKTREKKQNGLWLNGVFGGSKLRFPFLDSDIIVNSLALESIFWVNGKTSVPVLVLKSNILNLDSTLEASFAPLFEKSTYSGNVKNIAVKGADFFKLIGFQSSGDVSLTGRVFPEKGMLGLPSFLGKATWNHFTLEGFDIYSGSSDVNFRDGVVLHRNTIVKTHRNTMIYATGKFQLYDTFYFENQARLTPFSLVELLNGLGVSPVPVDLQVQSNNVVVSGNIMPHDRKKMFDLAVRGEGDATPLRVLAFDQNGRKPLPSMRFNVNLKADRFGVSFAQSHITLQNEGEKGRLDVLSGGLILNPEKGVGVKLEARGENVDLGVADYFLKLPSQGQMHFTGALTMTPGQKDLNFAAHAAVGRGSLLGFQFASLKSDWGVDLDGVWAKNARVQVTEKTLVDSPEFRINFRDLKTRLRLNAKGEVSELVTAAPDWVPALWSRSRGHINTLLLELQGPLQTPEVWNLRLDANLARLSLLDGKVERARVDLKCTRGRCENSSLSLENISAENDEGLVPGATVNSSVLLGIRSLSFSEANFKGRVVAFPLSILDPLFPVSLSGKVSSSMQLSGKWAQLDGVAQARILQFGINETELGNWSFELRKNVENKLQLSAMAFNQQLRMVSILPGEGQKEASLQLTLNRFDPFLLAGDMRANLNVFSQLNVSFLAKGPLVFSSAQKNNWLSWVGSGRVERSILQIGNIESQLISQEEIRLKEGLLHVPQIGLTGNLFNLNVQGDLDLRKNKLDFGVRCAVDFSYLDKAFTTFFDSSDGGVNGQVRIVGSLDEPEMTGVFDIHSKALRLKKFAPDLLDLNGKVVLNRQRIEVQSLTAQKGEGHLSLSGAADFSSYLQKGQDDEAFPELSIRLVTNNIDLRVPVPIFQLFDTKVTSDLVLAGNRPPYLLSGGVNIKNLRVYRDINCAQISSEILARPHFDRTFEKDPLMNFDVTFRAQSSLHIQTQCLRGQFSTAPSLVLMGDSNNPVINGGISADNAALTVLKTRFDVKKASLQFIDVQRYDPNVDIQMIGKVGVYSIYWNINGRLTQAALDLSSNPSTLSNGDRISQPEIISMISTGRVPQQSSSGNLISASTGVASFLGWENVLESTLNDTVSTVTGGAVDSVSIVPSTQNGQLGWRATANKSVSQRLNLGVSYEGGGAGSSRDAFANYMFNDTVSAIGSFSSTSFNQQQTTTEVFGGLRFQFGSQ